MKLLRFIVPSRAFTPGKVTALAACGGLLLAAVACGGPSDVTTTPETPGGGPRGSRAITNEFQVRGELIFKTQANLAFRVPGEVGAVNVAVGDLVAEGDVLATLDAESLTAVGRAAAQAKVDLEKAQDRLDQVMGLQSDDPLVLARSESVLANAEIALERAQDKLDDYQLTHNVQLGAARQAVADAKADVDRAEEAVSDFADGYSEQFAEALDVRSRAKVALDTAEDAVTDFLPRHDESIGQLSKDLSEKENALDDARDAVRDFDANHADRLAAARGKLAEAEKMLDDEQEELNEFQAIIFGDGFRGLGDGENFDVVQFNALQGAVTIAQQAVNTWEAEVNNLKGGPKEVDRSAAISHVAELEGTLVRLNRELNDSLAGPDSDELRRLEATVQIARSRLSRADRDLAEAEQGVDQLELARLQASADSARFSLDSAVTQLARLEEGLDQATLESLTKEVATAQEARDELVAGSDASEVALAQANIDAAAATYERVLGDLDDAILNAPFDGVVRLVTIAPGDAVTVDARVIQVVDPQNVSVLGLVESNFIDSVELGKPATVTMSSLTGVEFSARVIDISDDARTERGIISFPVVFDVTVPSGVSVPPYPGLVTTTVRR